MVGELHYSQSDLFAGVLCHTGIPCGNILRNLDVYLKPVDFLFESHVFYVAGIVVGIIDGVHRANHVEVFDEHAFLVEIRQPQRALNGYHTSLASPVGHST